MQRRAFVAAVAASAMGWPLAARAQQPNRMRRVGILMQNSADDAAAQGWLAAFVGGLQDLGWQVDGNLQFNVRWGAGDTAHFRRLAAELVAAAPDVVLATANSIVGDLEQATRTIPIVFVSTIDPVGSGLVASLARPGGNATGFIAFEFSLNAKLLELLRQVAPGVKRVAVVRDAFVPAGSAGFAAIQTVAASVDVDLTLIGVRDADEIERGIADFASRPNGGLIVVGPPSSIAPAHRELIVGLAVKHRLPAVYATLGFVPTGGMVCYGADNLDQYRGAATYVDRILKGERPAELPVQAPTKYKLVVNRKIASASEVVIPPSLLAVADQVIE
jgi:putative ABC transport system substrate-binding protein